jgi:2-keto-3-deoxy-galactonokinase
MSFRVSVWIFLCCILIQSHNNGHWGGDSDRVIVLGGYTSILGWMAFRYVNLPTNACCVQPYAARIIDLR